MKEAILNYEPINMQEEKDKELFLKYLNEFDNILTRDNEYAHFCSSGFVVNKERTKVLMVYHKIYDSWAWTGGHSDGEEDGLYTALREVMEETGLSNVNPIKKEIYAIDSLPVLGHIKRGKYVPAHTHLSVCYLLEASDKDEIRIKEDENTGVKWIDIDSVVSSSTERHMQYVYKKIIDKIKEKKD